MQSRCIALVLYIYLSSNLVAATCSAQNYCNGHGTCDGSSSKCICYEGYGAPTDITLYRSPDCTAMTCPAGKAWADVPSAAKVAHALAECSNMGICDRTTGKCKCFKGFTGDACQRNMCPNDCSGHGQCMNMKQMAQMSNAQPLNNNTFYEGEEETLTWDQEKLYGCVCDSKWSVGLASGETQEAEWFGHCPSADDPYTQEIDETDCEGLNTVGGQELGAAGNLCHVDCANRGVCNFKKGTCDCFDGYYGVDCTKQDVRAVYNRKTNIV